MTLKLKLILYYMLIFLLIMISVSSIILKREEKLIENEMSERVKILSNTLSQISLEPLLVYEINSLENHVDSIKNEKYVKFARVITKDKLILASTDRTEEGKIYDGKLKAGLSHRDNFLIGLSKIKLSESVIGYSEVVLSLLPMQRKINENIKIFISITIISIIAAFWRPTAAGRYCSTFS